MMIIESGHNIDSQENENLFNFGIYHLSYNGNNDEQALHCHGILELNFVISGKGKYFIDDKVYDVIPGDIFVFSNIEYHNLVVDTDDFVNMIIHFEPEFIWSQEGNMFDYLYLKPFFDRNDKFKNCLNRNNSMVKELQRLFFDIQREVDNKNDGFELMIKNKLLDILAYIVRYYECTSEKDNLNLCSIEDLYIMKRVKDHIDFHISDDLTLEQLASLAQLSESYFSVLFKKFNGVSPINYIILKRVQRAIEFLKTTDKSNDEIAMLCGFKNIANFYKSFKKVTGQIPSFFRTDN